MILKHRFTTKMVLRLRLLLLPLLIGIPGATCFQPRLSLPRTTTRTTRTRTTTTITRSKTTRLGASLKPAAIPLMDAGKAMARSGELMIDVTTQLDLYGGALSSVGAQVRNAGDSLAQAAASMRFKTGSELVTDELRECGTCLQEAAQKCRLAVAEAQQDGSHDLVSILERMQDPFSMGGQALESAGAGILQRIPVSDVGTSLTDAAVQIKVIARLLPQLAPNESDAALAGQRLDYCAQQMTRAGQELQGVVPDKPKGKSWLKGGS